MSLITNHPDFDNVRMVRIPSKPIKVNRAIRQETTVILDLGDNHFAVCRTISDKDWAYPMSFKAWPWQRHFLEALGKIGVVSKEAVVAEIKATEEKDRRRELKNDQDYLDKLAKKYGFKPPKIQ